MYSMTDRGLECTWEDASTEGGGKGEKELKGEYLFYFWLLARDGPMSCRPCSGCKERTGDKEAQWNKMEFVSCGWP